MGDGIQRLADIIAFDIACQINSSVVAQYVRKLCHIKHAVDECLLSLHSLKPFLTLTQNPRAVGIQCKYITPRENESRGSDLSSSEIHNFYKLKNDQTCT